MIYDVHVSCGDRKKAWGIFKQILVRLPYVSGTLTACDDKMKRLKQGKDEATNWKSIAKAAQQALLSHQKEAMDLSARKMNQALIAYKTEFEGADDNVDEFPDEESGGPMHDKLRKTCACTRKFEGF